MTNPGKMIYCTRVEDLPRLPPHVTGVRTYACARCGKKVWMSKASAELHASGWIAMCRQCAEGELEDGKPVAIMPPTTKQSEELKEWDRKAQQN